MKHIILTVIVVALASTLAPRPSAAQPPPLINYQGRLLNGTNLYSGPANLTFRLFNTNVGGSALFVSTNVATVVDGLYATAIGQFVILGSLDAALTNAFAAGRRANANHTGSFVWGDSIDTNVTSTANNQVTFRSSGGFRIFTSGVLTSGVQVAANSGAWTSISDVNAKEAFEPVNPAEVLEKVAALPITTWRYKGQDAEIRHMGPTAQDFYAAFGLGDLPGTGITTIDPDGVALAAIQALAKENAEFKMQNAEMRRENMALRAEIEAIKQRLGM